MTIALSVLSSHSLRMVAALSVLSIAACTEGGPQMAAPSTVSSSVPESVAAAAASNQDLSFVELRPEDNCYWYRHRGPVETTMLPLRASNGRPICVKVVEPEAAEATS